MGKHAYPVVHATFWIYSRGPFSGVYGIKCDQKCVEHCHSVSVWQKGRPAKGRHCVLILYPHQVTIKPIISQSQWEVPPPHRGQVYIKTSRYPLSPFMGVSSVRSISASSNGKVPCPQMPQVLLRPHNQVAIDSGFTSSHQGSQNPKSQFKAIMAGKI